MCNLISFPFFDLGNNTKIIVETYFFLQKIILTSNFVQKQTLSFRLLRKLPGNVKLLDIKDSAKVYFNLEWLKIWRTSPNLTHFGSKTPQLIMQSWDRLGFAAQISFRASSISAPPNQLEFFDCQIELNWVRFFKFELF